MPYVHSKGVTKYRVTVEEYTEWKTSLTAEELKTAGDGGHHSVEVDGAEWKELDVFSTPDRSTFAGALESIAKRYAPDPEKTYR
jgi:hypothetical protein